jgi:catechol 2,3-dioxygenase-like lactoylglutathione lyase family enzyme
MKNLSPTFRRAKGERMDLYDVRIVTADVDQLVRFYEQVTGIEVARLDPDYAELRTAGGVVAISARRKVDARSPGAATPAANRSAILGFRVADVDRERVRLDGVVGEIVLEPTDQPWGNRALMFRDPDGNLINFFHPLRR